jgi:NadR type nicotinamide-nucleotide adenylyltransferase
MDKMEEAGLIKVAVVGAESTGKTWLCERLAAYFDTVWVPEYARKYFNDSDIYNYTMKDLEVIAEEQLQSERAMITVANRFLFCDTSMITIKIWAELEFGKPSPVIIEKLKEEKFDHYLIADNSIPWEKDELRQNKFGRDRILQMNLDAVSALKVPYTVISGGMSERLREAVNALENVIKNG